MMPKAFIFSALLLVCFVLAEAVTQNEMTGGDPLKHTTTFEGYGSGGLRGHPVVSIPNTGGEFGHGGGGGAGGYSAGFSHGGVYGGGQMCKMGCCSESYGYSHRGGGYYGCTCCGSIAEAKAYKEAKAKAQAKN